MHMFNNGIQKSKFKGPVRNSKPKRILPKHIQQLILKNIVFAKRFTIKTALLTTGLCIDKPNRRSVIMFRVGNNNYLNVIINLPSINTYKYINRAFSIHALPIKLTDSLATLLVLE